MTDLPRLKNLDDLINLFKTLQEQETISGIGFDMDREYITKDSTHKECGSACCIGGWVQACNPETRRLSIEEALHTIAPHIDKTQTNLVCWPRETSIFKNAKTEHAIQVLEALRDTGECIWDRIEIPESQDA